MSLALSVKYFTTNGTYSITVSTFMMPVSFICIVVELPSISGGEHKNIPCIHRIKELKNKGVQTGSLHLS